MSYVQLYRCARVLNGLIEMAYLKWVEEIRGIKSQALQDERTIQLISTFPVGPTSGWIERLVRSGTVGKLEMKPRDGKAGKSKDKRR